METMCSMLSFVSSDMIETQVNHGRCLTTCNFHKKSCLNIGTTSIEEN